MGVHQYYLTVLPKGVDQFDEEGSYWTTQPPAEFLDELRRLLPNRDSWGSVEEYLSKAEWGSDLRLWHVDNSKQHIESIYFRYSPVADPPELLETFLDCISRYRFVVHSRASGRILEPEIATVVADLKTTPAFRFLSDPEGTIVEGAKNLKSPQYKPPQ
jgi:hypothetical protein